MKSQHQALSSAALQPATRTLFSSINSDIKLKKSVKKEPIEKSEVHRGLKLIGKTFKKADIPIKNCESKILRPSFLTKFAQNKKESYFGLINKKE